MIAVVLSKTAQSRTFHRFHSGFQAVPVRQRDERLLPNLTVSTDIRVFLMTMDQSLRVKAGAIKSRNVLTRAERVERMKQLGKFDESNPIVGMPKVRVVKVSLKRKKKVKKADDEK